MLAITLGLAPAWAATLGGLSAGVLDGWRETAGAVAPNVVGWSDFALPNNTNLNGQPVSGGGTWSAQFGTWRSFSGRARSSNTAYSNLTTATGTVAAAVEATLIPGGSPHAGLVALSDGTSFLFTVYEKTGGGRIGLFSYVSGTVTQLAQVTGTGTPASAPMRLDTTTNTVKVSWNGAVVLTYALTPAQVTAFTGPGHTRFGLVADGDPTTNFDDIHVDT